MFCLFVCLMDVFCWFFFFQAEDGIRDGRVTGVQTCALPILRTQAKTFKKARKTATFLEWEGIRPFIAPFSARGELLVKICHGTNSAEVIFEREVLVGSVSVLIRQPKTHQYAGNLECVIHLRHEGNRTSFPNENSLLSEALLERVQRFLENRRRVGGNPRFAGAQHLKFALYRFGKELPDMALHLTRNLFRVLLRHKSCGKLRERLRWDHSFCAFSRVSAPNAV